MEHTRLHPRTAEDQASPGPSARSVWLVEDRSEDWQRLHDQLHHFGYQTRAFPGLDALVAALEAGAPDALILGMEDLGPDGLAAARFVDGRAPGALLFYARTDDFAARLRAVQGGGEGFFVRPLDPNEIIDRLDALLDRGGQEEAARILIVEDSRLAAIHYAKLLESVGMQTFVVRDPQAIMEPLVEFKPDLILMDMYLPTCNGMELAQLIRQMDAYLSIPIVFLSSESNLDKRQQAMRLGGDDFISKPVAPDHLISSVLARVQRSRALRSRLLLDGLTGLFNRSATDQRLDAELAGARRRGSPLAVAVLDIDHFKSVNDTYGHHMGDQVIKSLARFLKRRLPRTDVVGRYGGEEFVVLMPDTPLEEARRTLDALRLGFSQLAFKGPERLFHASFSCGVTEGPGAGDGPALIARADEGLYAAKRGGRNQVVPVPAEH